MGTYFALAYNPFLLIATLISWSLYYTVLGVMASFVVDGAGPAAASLFLLLVLLFVSYVYKMWLSFPINAAYSVEYYLVLKTIMEVTSNKASRAQSARAKTS